MAGKSKRTVRTVFAVIFMIIGIVSGLIGLMGLVARQAYVSDKKQIEKSESYIIQYEGKYMEREEFFKYVDDEISSATPMVIVFAGVAVIFIGLSVNNIKKNKKDKMAEQLLS